MADGNITVEVSIQNALTADVFEALDLRPEQFLTEGGSVNRGKLRAALWYPHDYLPEGHWMRAADEGRLRAENAALKRDLQHARDGLTKGRTRMREDNERLRALLSQALHALETESEWGGPTPEGAAAIASLREALGPNAKAKRTQRPAGEATMNTTTQPGPLEVRLSDQLGPAPARSELCQPDGLRFDALGAPRERYVRVTLNGSHCVMRPSDGDCYVEEARNAGDPDWERYIVRDVWLSEREFEDLPEHNGF